MPPGAQPLSTRSNERLRALCRLRTRGAPCGARVAPRETISDSVLSPHTSDSSVDHITYKTLDV
eukprot:5877839-Prymnesium_polylepis.2